MASTQQLKSRIRSVKSTKQITKAMQMVAASKMRRAQDATKASAPYARAANEILAYFGQQGITDEHPLFIKRNVKARLIIVVASDKGLAGAYNNNVMKHYVKMLREDEIAGVKTKTIAVGRKAEQFVSRLKNIEVVGVYGDLPDRPSGTTFFAILSSAQTAFESGEVDAVDILYTDFVSSMSQITRDLRVLPAGYEKTKIGKNIREAKYEPDPNTIIDGITTRMIGAQLFQSLLDSRASEHSMRMLAMKNATDNASDLVDDLTLEMNKARQGAITQELSEISAGVEAIK